MEMSTGPAGEEGCGALEAGDGAADGEAGLAHEADGGGTPADARLLAPIAVRAALQRIHRHCALQLLQPLAHLQHPNNGPTLRPLASFDPQ